MEDKIIVQLAQPEREFVKVYKDFLNCKLLTAEEKIIYIALKSFVTYGRDSDEVYPSMETLCSITSMSKPRATRTITSLVKKGIIKKQRRNLLIFGLRWLAVNKFRQFVIHKLVVLLVRFSEFFMHFDKILRNS